MSRFQEEILKLPAEQRCIQTSPGSWNLPLGNCFLGVPPGEFFGWSSLDTLPATISDLRIYLGSDCLDLINAFKDSNYPAQLENLSIGNSSFGLGSGLDYREIVETLSQIDFPNLRVLELGVWELFHNAGTIYGKLGDVTSLMDQLPQLQELYLNGFFELSERVHKPELKKLSVTIDDPITGINGGEISQDTLDNLLESRLPKLEEIYLNLECDDNDQNYTISTLFESGDNVPNLKSFELSANLKEGEAKRFSESPLKKNPNCKCFIEELSEL